MRDPMERRQTSVIIEARPKVLLGAAVFIFYMGVKVGGSKATIVNDARRINNAMFEEKYRPPR